MRRHWIQKPPLGVLPNPGHPLFPKGGLWLMNEGSGNKVFDLSGKGNNGTFFNNPSWSSGKFGSSVYLPAGGSGDDDSSDAIQIATLNGFSGYGTFICWIKREDTSRTEYIIDQSTHDIISIIDSTDIYLYPNFGDDSGDVLQVTYPIDTSWHQLVLVFDDVTNLLAIYIDGVLKGSDSTQAWMAATVTDLIIGNRDALDEDYAFKGLFDHAMLYNRPLFSQEIALLYRKPFCMFAREPIELWSAAFSGALGNAGIMTTNAGYWGPTF